MPFTNSTRILLLRETSPAVCPAMYLPHIAFCAGPSGGWLDAEHPAEQSENEELQQQKTSGTSTHDQLLNLSKKLLRCDSILEA